jgi:hypothetical protein
LTVARKCELESEECDKLAVWAATFKGSDVLYSAGDRIELALFLSNADPLLAVLLLKRRASASGLVPRATCEYMTVLVAVTTPFFPFLPFSALTPS